MPLFLRSGAYAALPKQDEDASSSTEGQHDRAKSIAIGTRKDALLRALRTNPDILKVDPCAEKNSEALFKAWEEKEVTGVEGGVLGTGWDDRRAEEIKDAGSDLLNTRDALG